MTGNPLKKVRFSAENLWRMRQFFAEYSAPGFLEQVVPEMKKSRDKSLEQVADAVRDILPKRNSMVKKS